MAVIDPYSLLNSFAFIKSSPLCTLTFMHSILCINTIDYSIQVLRTYINHQCTAQGLLLFSCVDLSVATLTSMYLIYRLNMRYMSLGFSCRFNSMKTFYLKVMMNFGSHLSLPYFLINSWCTKGTAIELLFNHSSE